MVDAALVDGRRRITCSSYSSSSCCSVNNVLFEWASSQMMWFYDADGCKTGNEDATLERAGSL